jgi:hypothetical protein
MATLLDLVSSGHLVKFDPGLEANELEHRVIFASQKFQAWVTGELPALGSEWQIEVTPLEQFDALAEVYASGEALTFGHRFKPLNPSSNGVWELKTPDLRIFGWFKQKDHFIAVVADLAENVKKNALYAAYRREVVQFRNALNLDPPKFVPGENPHDVVSNFDYP